jgi:DNA-binding protein H-NS
MSKTPQRLLKQDAVQQSTPQTMPKKEAAQLDLPSYSFDALLSLKKEIDAEVESRKTKEIEVLRAKVTESAETLGVSVYELFGLQAQNGKRVTRHARGTQPAKYRGPGGEEWSGRGPAPRWMKPLLAKGKTKEDFLIRQ